MPEVIAYTDGGWRKTKDVGAWAYLIINTKNQKAVACAKAERNTTNNRMELSSVISVLKALKTPGKDVLIYSDSKYTINVCSRWLQDWKGNGWQKNTRGELKNVDILQEIDRLLVNHKTTFQWVKGHSGNRGNDYVDNLLNKAMNNLLEGGTGEIHKQIEKWED